MQKDTPEAAPLTVRSLRAKLHNADDQKITRIISVVDAVSDPKVNQTLLEPFRERLAILKPVRPVRFSRMLFTPLNPLIVSVGGRSERR
jgi:hypothetical protein